MGNVRTCRDTARSRAACACSRFYSCARAPCGVWAVACVVCVACGSGRRPSAVATARATQRLTAPRPTVVLFFAYLCCYTYLYVGFGVFDFERHVIESSSHRRPGRRARGARGGGRGAPVAGATHARQRHVGVARSTFSRGEAEQGHEGRRSKLSGGSEVAPLKRQTGHVPVRTQRPRKPQAHKQMWWRSPRHRADDRNAVGPTPCFWCAKYSRTLKGDTAWRV